MNGRSLRTTTTKADVMFCVGAVTGFVLLLISRDSQPEIASAYSTTVVAAITAVGTVLLAVIAAYISDIERRCAEHYAYQNIANAAVIAIMTTVFAHSAWQIAAMKGAGLRSPHSTDTIAIMIVAWAAGYFILRIRGVKS